MNSIKEMRRNIMMKAHAMCREMKTQGFEFDYHAQLGINIKYLWEVVGETIDTIMEEVPASTTVEDSVEEAEIEEYDEEEEYVEHVVEDTEEEYEEEESDYTLECVNYVSLPDNTGYSFLFKLYLGDTIQEFVAYANKNHRLPIVFDADPNDMELLERVKAIINDETHIYNSIEKDYVPDYRYTRGEDYFIYFDEVANIFKGYYCGNEVYGGRAFVFDINSKEGPCSRAIRQLIKDHKAESFGKYTTMNGKGTTITKWRDKLLEECRALYKLSKNSTKIQEAKAVIEKPWNYKEVRVNAAIRFLAQMNIEYNFKYESYDAAIDAKLRNLAETYDPNSKFNKLSDKLIAKFQDRIRQLQLTNLYRGNVKTSEQPAQSEGTVVDEFADVEL